MGKKEVPAELAENQVADLQRAFESLSAVKPAQLTDEQLRIILQLAVDSWVGIVTGRTRHRSLTEQQLDWLGTIYNTVLAGEEPSERRLFDRLGFPYGQAQYLTRVLREQERGAWRRQAMAQLRTALAARLADAKKMVKENRAGDWLRFTISKSSKVELDQLLGNLSEREGKGDTFAKKIGTNAKTIVIELAASSIEPLVQEIDRITEEKP